MKKLSNKGFAVSGILYPVLILTVFLLVQVLTMMASRKSILDDNKQQLLDSVNAANKVYTNEELSTIVSSLQEENKTLKTELDKTKTIVNTVSSDSGWKTLVDGINYRKIGSVAFIEFINYSPKTTNWHSVGTLPAEYATSQTRYGSSVGFNGSTANDIMTSISPTGNLNIYVNETKSVVGMFVYPIG